jgi:hypothetical protein
MEGCFPVSFGNTLQVPGTGDRGGVDYSELPILKKTHLHLCRQIWWIVGGFFENIDGTRPRRGPRFLYFPMKWSSGQKEGFPIEVMY